MENISDFIDRIAEIIQNNPYFVIISFCVAILGIITSIVIAIIQKRKKRLSYSYSTNVLVTDKLSKIKELVITFKGKEINQLSITSFKISNNGNVTIENDDVYKGHELEIISVAKEDLIIGARPISHTSDTVDARTSFSESKVKISFQTLEPKDYLTVNVYHRGDENTKFELTGKIKETKIVSLQQAKKFKKNVQKGLVLLIVATGVYTGYKGHIIVGFVFVMFISALYALIMSDDI